MAAPMFWVIPHTGGRKFWVHAGEPSTGMKEGDILSDTTADLIKYYDGSSWTSGSVSVPDSAVTNAKVASNAAIAWSKMAALTTGSILLGVANVATVTDVKTDGQILIGNGTTIASQPITGDISLTNAGVTAIASGVIVNDDVKSDAAIAWSKMATSTDISSSGTVTDLTIASEAQGDVLYRGASAWSRLAAGTAGQALVTAGAGSNPYWGTPTVGSASALANSVTLEGGASDYTLVVGTAGGAYNLTIPAVGGHRSFAFIDEAQTFTAVQTFANSGVHILDTNASHDLIITPGSDLSADRIFTITTGDAARTLTMGGDVNFAGAFTTAGAWTHTGAHTLGVTTTNNTAVTLPTTGTLATLAGAEVFENKKLEATCAIVDTTDNTKDIVWNLAGATADKTVTLTSSQTEDRAITLPDATDTLVGKATTDTFTNKTIDADGTGNVISNLNADELDSTAFGGTAAYGVPFVIHKQITDLAEAGSNLVQNSAFKYKIIDAWSINRSASSGSWQLCAGSVGAVGTAITNAVSVGASDTDVDRVGTIDDAQSSIAAGSGGDLCVVGDAGGALDIELFVLCLRID